MTYEIGQKVTCNGNPESRILAVRGDMYEVTLMDGTRYVGVVAVSKRDLDIENG